MKPRRIPSPIKSLAPQTRGLSTAVIVLQNGRRAAHQTTPPSSRPTSHDSSPGVGKKNMTPSSSNTKNEPRLPKQNTRSDTRITSIIRCPRRRRKRCARRRRRRRRGPGRKLRLPRLPHHVLRTFTPLSLRIPLLPPAPTSSSRTWSLHQPSPPLQRLTPLLCLAWRLSRSSAAAVRHPRSTTTPSLLRAQASPVSRPLRPPARLHLRVVHHFLHRHN